MVEVAVQVATKAWVRMTMEIKVNLAVVAVEVVTGRMERTMDPATIRVNLC
jgi:hypothetical protein